MPKQMLTTFTIRLTPNEFFAAGHHALMRKWGNLIGMARERTPTNNQADFDFDNGINSCCAEMAFAKMLGTYWSGLADLRAPDTAWGEVRWTRLKDRGGLIIYPHDLDDRRYVLMDGLVPEYNLIGWLRGREGKLLGVWDSVKGYYLVSRADIHGFKRRSDSTPPGPNTESAESPEQKRPASTDEADSYTKASDTARGASLDQ